MTSIRTVRWGAVVLGLAASGALADAPGKQAQPTSAVDGLWEPDAADGPPPATRPALEAQKEAAIEKMVVKYLEMYGKHLSSKDWITRAMGVIGLGRIDDPRVTEKLLGVLEADKACVVRAFAWEAVHARMASLTDEQRKKWLEAGVKLHARQRLNGEQRPTLVTALGHVGPTRGARRVVSEVFANTNLRRPADQATLCALRQVVAKWRHAGTVKGFVDRMFVFREDCVHDAWRAEYVLAGLGAGVRRNSEWGKLGSREMWKRTQVAWTRWLLRANLQAAKPAGPSRYSGTSDLLDPPVKIDDPYDLQWRRGLELPELVKLRNLDVVFVMDSTGSMGPAIAWIRSEVVRLMRAFHAISRQPRIGVTLYRDRDRARDERNGYVVQMIPMTAKEGRLAQQISNVRTHGGGDMPEAVGDGLCAAVLKNKWSRGDDLRRVVILVGDAPPHENTVPAMEKVVTAAAAKGVRFYCMKVRTRCGASDLPSFDRIAELGSGNSIWVDFEAHPERLVFGEVLKTILDEPYHGLVEPFTNVLMAYADRSYPELRKHWGPDNPYRQPSPQDIPRDDQGQPIQAARGGR